MSDVKRPHEGKCLDKCLDECLDEKHGGRPVSKKAKIDDWSRDPNAHVLDEILQQLKLPEYQQQLKTPDAWTDPDSKLPRMIMQHLNRIWFVVEDEEKSLKYCELYSLVSSSHIQTPTGVRVKVRTETAFRQAFRPWHVPIAWHTSSKSKPLPLADFWLSHKCRRFHSAVRFTAGTRALPSSEFNLFQGWTLDPHAFRTEKEDDKHAKEHKHEPKKGDASHDHADSERQTKTAEEAKHKQAEQAGKSQEQQDQEWHDVLAVCKPMLYYMRDVLCNGDRALFFQLIRWLRRVWLHPCLLVYRWHSQLVIGGTPTALERVWLQMLEGLFGRTHMAYNGECFFDKDRLPCVLGVFTSRHWFLDRDNDPMERVGPWTITGGQLVPMLRWQIIFAGPNQTARDFGCDLARLDVWNRSRDFAILPLTSASTPSVRQQHDEPWFDRLLVDMKTVTPESFAKYLVLFDTYRAQPRSG